ncbi:4675_t:CDS:2, partial [Gigaspora margarita]
INYNKNENESLSDNNGDLSNEIFVAEDNDENINKSNSTKILGILKKEIQVEPHIIDIMNLSLKSEFVKQIPLETYKKFIELSENYDKLIPDETHKFLVDFFSQDLTQQQWIEAIDNLNIKDYNEDITKIAIKTFLLGHMNPLHDKEILEHSFLNDYVHPCLKAALWNCANVYYTSREILSPNHVKYQKGDGIGFATNSNKYQIVYVEGTRPYKVD